MLNIPLLVAFLLGIAFGLMVLAMRQPTTAPLFYDSLFPKTSVIDGKPLAVFCRTFDGFERCDFLRPK